MQGERDSRRVYVRKEGIVIEVRGNGSNGVLIWAVWFPLRIWWWRSSQAFNTRRGEVRKRRRWQRQSFAHFSSSMGLSSSIRSVCLIICPANGVGHFSSKKKIIITPMWGQWWTGMKTHPNHRRFSHSPLYKHYYIFHTHAHIIATGHGPTLLQRAKVLSCRRWRWRRWQIGWIFHCRHTGNERRVWEMDIINRKKNNNNKSTQQSLGWMCNPICRTNSVLTLFT